jgi:hypothetical protein
VYIRHFGAGEFQDVYILKEYQPFRDIKRNFICMKQAVQKDGINLQLKANCGETVITVAVMNMHIGLSATANRQPTKQKYTSNNLKQTYWKV